MGKRIKFNTTWEEDKEERRLFYTKLTYAERLGYFIKAGSRFNFHTVHVIKGYDLLICNAKVQTGPYKELFIADENFDFYDRLLELISLSTL